MPFSLSFNSSSILHTAHASPVQICFRILPLKCGSLNPEQQLKVIDIANGNEKVTSLLDSFGKEEEKAEKSLPGARQRRNLRTDSLTCAVHARDIDQERSGGRGVYVLIRCLARIEQTD
jgi:hypothetical protein